MTERETTRELFQHATSTVRTWPLDPPDRKPAFALEQISPVPVPSRDGLIEGLAGDLWETRDQLRAGSRTVGDVVASAVERIDRYGSTYGAFEYVADVGEDTRLLAAEAGAGAWRGPLHGIPISVKDVIDVRGMPTRGSSVALPPRIAREDPTAVARLWAAGAVIVGKAATHEFALGVTTPRQREPVVDGDQVERRLVAHKPTQGCRHA
ncbi:MAG: hypothetical protein EPO65_00290, partial [Dehalococcoidia bacterium]